MAQIFISYKRIDKDKVFSIVEKIERELGCECWVDLEGIESSVQFASVICSAIDKSDVVLFMHSSAHLTIDFETDWTVKELTYAQMKKKRVVLVKLDNTPLDNIFLMEYGSKNNIDSQDPTQFNKLLNDLRSWLHLPHPKSASQYEAMCPCGSGKLFKDCHGKTDKVPVTSRQLAVDERTKVTPRRAIYDQTIEQEMSKILKTLNAYKLTIACITANVQSNGVMYKITPGSGTRPSAIANIHREIALSLGVNKVEATVHADGVALVVTKETIWKVGDYYNVDGKLGVVFWVDKTGKHGKIVSLDQKELQWCTADEYKKKLTGIATDESDGMRNLQSIMKISDWRNKYPAFAWCADHGSGWYLPAIDELNELLLNDDVRDKVNSALTKKGISVMLPGIGNFVLYWSSTENDKWSAWRVNLDDGYARYTNRDHYYYVRAVSAF